MEDINWQPGHMICLAHSILNYLRLIVNIFKTREFQIKSRISTSSWKIRTPANIGLASAYHSGVSVLISLLWLSTVPPSMLHSLTWSARLPQTSEFSNPNLRQFLHFKDEESAAQGQKVNHLRTHIKLKAKKEKKSGSGIFLTAHCRYRTTTPGSISSAKYSCLLSGICYVFYLLLQPSFSYIWFPYRW